MTQLPAAMPRSIRVLFVPRLLPCLTQPTASPVLLLLHRHVQPTTEQYSVSYKKVKASYTRYRVLGPELIPVYRQSVVGCHYFPPGLWLPSQLKSITAPWLVQSYTAWWQRHIFYVNNLPKVVTQLLPRVEFEHTTCWLQVQRSTRWRSTLPVAPSRHFYLWGYNRDV